MNGDQLVHSVDVSGYWRTTPTGRRVWVPKYERKGNAYQDVVDAAKKKQVAVGNSHKLIADNYKKEFNRNQWEQMQPKTGSSDYMAKKINQASLDRFNRAADAYIKSGQRVNKANDELDKAVASKDDLKSKVKYAAIDVKEAVQEKVGNLVSEISFQAESVKDVTEAIVQGTPQVKATVQLGFSMIKNWFSGLFGRK